MAPQNVHARLEELIARHAARVRRLLHGYGLDRRGVDPADVEQEVHIRLWQAIERDRFGAFGASYIQRVVASTVIDALRRAEVRAAEPLPEQDEEPADFGEGPVGPARRARDEERMQALQACLDALPPRRRLPITLHLQGFSMQEVADLAGVTSAEAARKLIARGMAELRERLQAAGHDDLEG